MTPESIDLEVEIALLRASLWLTARTLKDYHDKPHRKTESEGRTLITVTVPESLHEKAGDVLAKAQSILQDKGRGR